MCSLAALPDLRVSQFWVAPKPVGVPAPGTAEPPKLNYFGWGKRRPGCQASTVLRADSGGANVTPVSTHSDTSSGTANITPTHTTSKGANNTITKLEKEEEERLEKKKMKREKKKEIAEMRRELNKVQELLKKEKEKETTLNHHRLRRMVGK